MIKKLGMIFLFVTIYICIGIKFNAFAMNVHDEVEERRQLIGQLEKLDARIAKKEQELEQSGRFEEFAVAKELNVLRRKQFEIHQKLLLQASPIREAMPAECSQLRKKFVQFLYSKTTKIFIHDDGVLSVAWSADGKKIAAGSQDRFVKIWDVGTDQQIGLNLPHSGDVQSIQFSSDSKKLLTGSSDNAARIWNLSTSVIVGYFQHSAGVIAVAFSPDDKKVVTGSYDDFARVWRVADPAQIELQLPHDGSVFAVAYSPDGKKIATGSKDKNARIWDAATGAQIGSNLVHGDYVRAVAWSPDGKKLATGSFDNVARIWDVAMGKQIGKSLPHAGLVYSIAFSNDGSTIVTGSSDDTAKIWDVATGKQVGPDLVHEDIVQTVAFSPDGSKVITGSGDKKVRIWDMPTQEFLASLNIDQCDLLRAFDQAIQDKGRIQSTDIQWYTFTTFPKAVQDALRLYIKNPRDNE